MTKKRKIEVLEKARQIVQADIGLCMCYALGDAMTKDEYFKVRSGNLIRYFGIVKPRTARSGFAFWFPYDTEGQKERIKCLTQAIKKLS